MKLLTKEIRKTVPKLYSQEEKGDEAVASKSTPEFNIGGTNFGEGPKKWMYQGINPIWEAD